METFWFWWDNAVLLVSLSMLIVAWRALRLSIRKTKAANELLEKADKKVGLALHVLKRCDRVIFSALELDVATFECSPEGVARAVMQVRRYGREAAEDVMQLINNKQTEAPPPVRH